MEVWTVFIYCADALRRPVATVAINAADNAAILAAQILSLEDETLWARLKEFKEKMAAAVIEKDKKLQSGRRTMKKLEQITRKAKKVFRRIIPTFSSSSIKTTPPHLTAKKRNDRRQGHRNNRMTNHFMRLLAPARSEPLRRGTLRPESWSKR
jgi:hypothetical protein